MRLTNTNKPVLLIHPSYNSTKLQQAAVELTEELTSIIRDVSFEDSTAQEISKVIKVAKRGIERIMAMNGSTPILSNDSVKAEAILNEAVETLAQALNDSMLELKKRMLTGESLFTYIEQLDSLIDTCLSWSQGKATESTTTAMLDEEDQEYL